MDRLLSMRTFLHVVDEGSFAAAARRLALNQAVVTRLIADLESHLGARLLNRTTRSLGVTEAGETYLLRCRQILADVDSAEEMVGAGTTRIGGKVRIAVPVVFGLEMMGPRLKKWRSRFPDIQLDIELFDRPVDPIAEGFDLAIVPSAYAVSSSVITRALSDKPIVLCAAATYLEAAGVPKTPNDLARHPCIGFCPTMTGPADHWKLTDAEGRPATVPVNIVLRSNNFALMRTAVRDGLGIGMLIEYTVETDLAEGRLIRVLPSWDVGAVHLNIVYPSREYLPRRVRALIDFVLEERDLIEQERLANRTVEQRKKIAKEPKAA